MLAQPPVTSSCSRSVDDGAGIPADAAESGLRNIRERAEQHGGHCEIGPAPGGDPGPLVRYR